MVNKDSESKYRWYVISLAALTLSSCMAAPQICMSVLFNEISADLGLSLIQIGWIWGFFPLSALLTVFVAGLMADRFGTKRIMVFACLMAGLSGASRGLANDFAGLIFTTFLFGLSIGTIPANIFKVAATWFPSRQMGLAAGVLTTGMGVGFTLSSMFSATLLSPMLGSWRNVLFLYGSIAIFIAFLWFITFKEEQTSQVAGAGERASFGESIHHVVHNRDIWLISLSMLGCTACNQGMCGYLPIYLREFKGWLPASADGTLAAFSGFSTLGAIPISLLSDRIGRRKIIILAIISLAATGVGLLSVADGVIIWMIVIMIGIGRDGLVALVNTSIIERKGIGVLYSGTAVGFIQTVSRLGPFISPPIGNSMASRGAGLPFIVWAAFGMIGLVCYSLTRETGHRRD